MEHAHTCTQLGFVRLVYIYVHVCLVKLIKYQCIADVQTTHAM